jgi:Uma2 family endonuclease
VFVAPTDVRLPKKGQTDEATDTVVQPDVVIVCDPKKIDSKGVRGAPDWIIEVLSPSTAGHDQILKRCAYETAGVREFWLVHPTDRIVTIYRLEAERYGVPDIRELKDETIAGALPDVSVRWAPIIERLRPIEP